jgi:hypothetical protein
MTVDEIDPSNNNPVADTVAPTNEDTVDNTVMESIGGRKNGTTVRAKKHNREAIKLATTSVATKYLQLKTL